MNSGAKFLNITKLKSNISQDNLFNLFTYSKALNYKMTEWQNFEREKCNLNNKIELKNWILKKIDQVFDKDWNSNQKQKQKLGERNK